MLDSAVKPRAHRKIYYGWVIVAMASLIFMITFAIQHSFGVFLKPLQETFGWSRAATSMAMTVHLVIYGLCMVPAAWVLDRFSTRVVFSIASLLVATALIMSSRILDTWQLYLVYGLELGIGLSIYGPASMALVTRWFTRNRGVALGLTSAGCGVGVLIGAPLSSTLIEAYGWRDAFLILGIAGGVILLACAQFMRSAPPSPENHLESADRKTSTGGERAGPSLSRDMTLGQAIRTREMVLLVLAQVFMIFTLRMTMVHIAPHATDIGISPWVAALAIGTIGGFSIIGRLGMGFVQDRIGPQRSMIICMSAQAAAMLALPFLRSDLLFFVFAAVFGLTYGGDMPQMPALTAQCFGVASIGLIYGLVISVATLGSALGPSIAGYIFDVTNSYTTIFLGAAVGLLVGVWLITRLKVRH